MTNVKFELMKQLSEVEKLILEVEKSLRSYKNLENGKLRMSKSNGCTQYLMIKPGTDKKEYIHSYEKEKIHLLAQREYEEKFHKTLLSIKKRLNRFIEGYDPHELEHVYDVMCDSRKRLVAPIVPSESIYIANWMEEHKGGVNTYGEAMTIRSLRGEYVRSKSEKIIADYLYNNNIPYQYEPKFEMSDYRNVFPDFVVLNVRERRTIYWEHLGRCGEPGYAIKNFNKIMDYEKRGLILGDNLIITVETAERPLNVDIVEEKVKLFLT
jgi:hypothetical protein